MIAPLLVPRPIRVGRGLRLPRIILPLWPGNSLLDSLPKKKMKAMLTDRAPRRPSLLAAFVESDRNGSLELPEGDRLQASARKVESQLRSDKTASTQKACGEFVDLLAGFYKVGTPGIRVLAARPLRSREGGWTSELFGDYDPRTKVIRVWMRTAVRKQVTSFGTFLSTLCHEFCHHLDYERFAYGDSWHTRGFYERAAALYHQARGTPPKWLFWIKMSDGRWRIDWARTNRGV